MRKSMRHRGLPVAGLALAAVLVGFHGAGPSGAWEPGLHLELLRASPPADSAVASPPSEVRLWFSEAPQMRGTSVRLADAAGELVATTEAKADPQDPAQIFIEPEATLSPGTYRVHWRVIAQDGHALNGEFAFRVE